MIRFIDKLQIEIEILDNKAYKAEERTDFENNYFSIVTRAQEIIDKNKLPTNQNNQTNSTFNIDNISNIFSQKVKLPLLNLPHFDGKYSEYTHFHDTFESLINKDLHLDNVQKFHYLISSLEGEALHLIQSLEITDNNYKIAWDLLKERYENKRIIINSHLKSLFDLPVLTKENATALRRFLDTFNKDIRALKTLGQPVSQWDSILIHLLVSKLDFSSKREWETKIKPNTLPTLDDFSKFLNARCQLLETLFTRSSNNNNINNNTSYENPKAFRRNFRSNESKSLNHVVTEKSVKCFYCKGDHCLFYCKDFLNLSNQNRYNEVKRLHLCINCLRPFPHKRSCIGGCKICFKKHNTLLHIDFYNKVAENQEQIKSQDQTKFASKTEQPSNSVQTENNILSLNAYSSRDEHSLVLLATANILIQDKKNNFIQCRALLDGGSQSNFISSKLARQLNLDITRINCPIKGIGEAAMNISKRVNSKIKSIHGDYIDQLSFLVLDSITGCIPSQTFDASEINIPEGISLADPSFNRSREVDILLGATVFYKLLTDGQIDLGKNRPILQCSKLGWLITGTLNLHNMPNMAQNCLFTMHDNRIQNQLERFWELEETPCATHAQIKYTQDELYCENHFVQNYTRDHTGRFIVALPLKDNFKDIGDTFQLAQKRFLNLERKLHGNKILFELYKNFMNEYEQLGHMTKLQDSEISTNETVFYLPHHGVLKPSSVTTKLRVVFDASAKSSTGISLNNVLYTGPTIQEDLFSILIRFRKHNYALKADVTKMYRQILIKPEHRNLQRILWREKPDDELSHFVLNTVTYGTAPGAFLSIRSIRQAAFDKKHDYPEASSIILEDFYVDDMITGADTIEDLQQLKFDICEVLKSAGFQLAQWRSNVTNVLDFGVFQENFNFQDNEMTKTLGISWNPNKDLFQFTTSINLNSEKLTKRIVLSVIGQIFDPLGIIGPVVIKAKIILQKLWKMRIDWDEHIPSDYNKSFLQFFNELSYLHRISVPRHVLLPKYIKVQFHGFCDASESAYGCCIYVRTISECGNIRSQLLCSKSRVAPLKVISLPRLELCGALLLARLLAKVIESMKLNIDEIFLWTDSKIVLGWLSKEPTHWKTFIANRVSEIQGLTDVRQWRHVSSADNPADIISRGCNPQLLRERKLWWSGPSFLDTNMSEWPYQYIITDNDIENIPEKRKFTELSLVVDDNCEFKLFNNIS